MNSARRKKMAWIALAAIALVFAAMVLALAACGSSNRPIPPPTFVAWCEECERHTEWDVLEDRFECSASGTAWEVGP